MTSQKGSKPNKFAALITGTIFGAIVWALSPVVTGHIEPWDAPLPYYPFALFVSGLISALAAPKVFWMAPIGLICGQVLYVLVVLNAGSMALFGAVFVIGHSLMGFLGATLMYIISQTIASNFKR